MRYARILAVPLVALAPIAAAAARDGERCVLVDRGYGRDGPVKIRVEEKHVRAVEVEDLRAVRAGGGQDVVDGAGAADAPLIDPDAGVA